MMSALGRGSELPRIQTVHIPRGYAGTRRTVWEIARLIREGAKDFVVRQAAIAILRKAGVTPKDYRREIETLFAWVRQRIRYTRDPHRVEALHSARRMLQVRAGDCDDMTILLGAMLKAVGHPVRVVITGPDRSRPKLFSHVYLEAKLGGRWLSLDPTMPHAMGWAPRAPIRERHEVETSENVATRPVAATLGCGVRPCASCDGAGTSLAEARALYRASTGHSDLDEEIVRHWRVMPPVAVELGELVGVMYRSDKWDPGRRPRTYVHFMERRPRLVCDPAGRQLYVVGGAYQVTPRGIEG